MKANFISFIENLRRSRGALQARLKYFHGIVFLFWIVLVLLDFGYWHNSRMVNSLILSNREFVITVVDVSTLFILLFSFFVFTASVLWQLRLYLDRQITIAPRKWLLKIKEYLIAKMYYLKSVLLWSLAIIVPGIVVAVLYVFGSAAVILDDVAPKESLLRSKLLIRANLNKILDQFLYILIVLGVSLFSLISSVDIIIDEMLAQGKLGIASGLNYLEYYFIVWALVCLIVFYGNVYRDITVKR